MVKKLSSLVLAGLLVLPTIALADNLEDRIAALEEKQESWDLGSRIQWNGDFRFRMDNVSADAPAHYSAMKLGNAIADFMVTGNVMNRYAALNPTDTVGAFMAQFGGATTGTGDTYTIAGSGGAGDTTLTATELAAMQKVLGSTTLGAILVGGGYMAYPIAGVTPSFTNLENLVAFMKQVGVANRVGIFNDMGYKPAEAETYADDTQYTNRFRLDMRAKAMENLEFKARLAMYKVWGMQNNASDYTYNNGMGGGPFMLSSLGFDGSAARQPQDSILRVDRAFINWNNIGGAPFWFSIGRRPVTDGPPAHIRMGTGKKMATPVAYMDYPFDGLSLGYAYENLFGIQDLPGRVRLCYGRGFEGGPTNDNDHINDVDFGGLSWDVFKKGDRFFNFQSFGAFNIFNVPDNIDFPNPVEYYLYQAGQITYNPIVADQNLILDRKNLGDIFHTSTVYMSKFQDLNYFVTLGWSRTKARGMDELGTSLLGGFYDEPTDRDGYSTLVGVRYDLDDMGLKLGAEYNWGSEYWISFTPGHDDLYASKLATRGNVMELYAIYDIPAGEAISKFSQAFFRLGYQHYEYDYTGSGFWLGKPQDISELAKDPLNAQFYVPVESMDQIYLTMEAWF